MGKGVIYGTVGACSHIRMYVHSCFHVVSPPNRILLLPFSLESETPSRLLVSKLFKLPMRRDVEWFLF